jgi:hypothetical protein
LLARAIALKLPVVAASRPAAMALRCGIAIAIVAA